MPFLVCDPVSQDEADHFLVDIDNELQQVDGERDDTAGTIRLHHDLGGLSDGEHVARIAAVNMWGDGPFSDPFDFTRAMPPAVSGIGLER